MGTGGGTMTAQRALAVFGLMMVLLTIALELAVGSASATFAGPVGRIGFTAYTKGQIYAVNPGGSGPAPAYSRRAMGPPDWSSSSPSVNRVMGGGRWAVS